MDHFAVLMFIFAVLLSNCIVNSAECYRYNGFPKQCSTPFVNAAFGKTFDATNTCGTPAEDYCSLSNPRAKPCPVCNDSDSSKRHDTTFLTDRSFYNRPTWWQSSTMLQNIQYPNMVNLTLNLGKVFDISYIRLKFQSSRPESFAIYKKKCENCDWQPFQYYSATCSATYGLDANERLTVGNEQKALCTGDHSGIIPLKGGTVTFSTLANRPNAWFVDRIPALQEWIKAAAIRITLNRVNTFGDEVSGDHDVLKSYYYAISDISVGGRCTCNGHASECYVGSDNHLRCHCEHNTAGKDCERCADNFNDRPWSRATQSNPGACQECDCNGHSNSCYFDPELYASTGHGGHCTECRENTYGPHCEFCKPNHYRDSDTNGCITCNCSNIGARDLQCSNNGQCVCKPGVGGIKCDHCLDSFYGLNESGCQKCTCSKHDTAEGGACNPITGECI